MRRVSFNYTQAQMRIGAAAARASRDGYAGWVEGGKDITRREGWAWAVRGMYLLAVSKCMGLRAGERAEVFGVVQIVDVQRVPLWPISHEDVRREGFVDLSPESFAGMFCAHMGCEFHTRIARVVFRHVDVRLIRPALLACTSAQALELGVEQLWLHERRAA